MRCSGAIVIGSTIMPDSERLTLSTSAACASIGRLRCTMPMPPFCAMQIAVRCSVTVSIAADTSGIESAISRVNCVETSTSGGEHVRGGGHEEDVVERQTLANPALVHAPSRLRSGVPAVAECTTANWGPRVGA